MTAPYPTVESIRLAMEHHPVRPSLEAERGGLTLEGEVRDVASKKLLLELAAAARGVAGIVDRLHVTPAQRMEDWQVRQHVVDALLGEPALRNCAVHLRAGQQVQRVREAAPGVRSLIEVRVEEGVVTLDEDINICFLAHRSSRRADERAWLSLDVVEALGP